MQDKFSLRRVLEQIIAAIVSLALLTIGGYFLNFLTSWWNSGPIGQFAVIAFPLLFIVVISFFLRNKFPRIWQPYQAVGAIIRNSLTVISGFFRAQAMIKDLQNRLEQSEQKSNEQILNLENQLKYLREGTKTVLPKLWDFFQPNYGRPCEQDNIAHTLDALIRLLPNIERQSMNDCRIMLGNRTLLEGKLIRFRNTMDDRWIGYLYAKDDVNDNLKGIWKINEVYELKIDERSDIIKVYIGSYDQKIKRAILWDADCNMKKDAEGFINLNFP